VSTYSLGLQSAPPPEENPVSCGSFWPAIPVTPLYDQYRIPAEIPADMVRSQLVLAALRCLDSLSEYAIAEQEAGYASLADIPAAEVDGQHALCLLWARACYCEAKAELLKATQTADQRKAAANQAKAGEETEDKYREFAAAALRQIAGFARIEAELI
jgi:hypothetical protein